VLGPFQVLKRPLTLTPKDVKPGPAGSTPAGPVAWWKLDESAGTTTANAAGKNLAGQIQGQPRWGPGHNGSGGALEFDGLKNWVEFPDSTSLDFRQGISVSLWFKVRAFERPAQTLIAKGDAWRLQRQAESGILEFALSGPVTTGTDKNRPPTVASKRSVDDGKWHHVAACYDGKRLVLYVDGVEENAVSASGTLALNSAPVSLGENDSTPGRLFNGWMDEVRLYACGLTADQVKPLYQEVKP